MRRSSEEGIILGIFFEELGSLDQIAPCQVAVVVACEADASSGMSPPNIALAGSSPFALKSTVRQPHVPVPLTNREMIQQLTVSLPFDVRDSGLSAKSKPNSGALILCVDLCVRASVTSLTRFVTGGINNIKKAILWT